MPVFHTKTIESILDPVAQQILLSSAAQVDSLTPQADSAPGRNSYELSRASKGCRRAPAKPQAAVCGHCAAHAHALRTRATDPARLHQDLRGAHAECTQSFARTPFTPASLRRWWTTLRT
ncbi:GL13394 [Drosophila persimilis]|uniref:GL13394 n=1 Tax=Drosophila persimilis TaxID=7234 RepID=B4H370_DROPE|nr:GL13394 [Drosophila persimilis]